MDCVDCLLESSMP